MKNELKNFLSKIGVYHPLDFIRYLPGIMDWLRGGCCGVSPPPVKRMVINSYLTRYDLRHFVETGTYRGDTLNYVAMNRLVQTQSIELSDSYYKAAIRRFARYPNVSLLHGDSEKLMPQVISSLQAPALFWLDGHYSGGLTAKGDRETPVSAELQSIFSSSIEGHVILIDDVRSFNGSHDYPHLDEFMAIIRKDSRYHVDISTDILRLTPKR